MTAALVLADLMVWVSGFVSALLVLWIAVMLVPEFLSDDHSLIVAEWVQRQLSRSPRVR